MHADNKENNSKQDKPKLSDIDEHTLRNCEKKTGRSPQQTRTGKGRTNPAEIRVYSLWYQGLFFKGNRERRKVIFPFEKFKAVSGGYIWPR
jgi:hypothetical protein